MAYQAIIAPLINVRPHPNADRLKLATVAGSQVIVGINKTDGELGIFFPCDGRLSHRMLTENKLYAKDPETGKKMGGYFGKNGRVRAQNFRGEKSDGFWVELTSIAWTGVDLTEVKEGDQFTHLNGEEICAKYVNPATLEAAGKKNRQKLTVRRRLFTMLKQHFDTPQLRYEIGNILPGSVIYLTEKVHGCVDKDTIVETLEHGPMRVQEVVEGKLNVHIKSLNTTTQKVEYAPVEDFYFYPNDDDWYEIELEDGTKLEITGNNPVWLPEYGGYRRADELEAGFTVLVD